MGFLDDLERQAREQKEREHREALAREEREAFFREVADPTFRQLFDYLKRLTGHLNYLGQHREVSYSAPGYGKIRGHVDDDLKVRFGSGERERHIDIAGTVTFPAQRTLEVGGEHDVRRLQSFARERGLHANERARRDHRGNVVAATFKLSGRINLRVVIRTTVDDPEFHMLFTNVCDFGRMVKRVAPEQMDASLMDKLGRFVARVDDDFLREDLDEEIREELARQLREERRTMVRELTGSDRERERVAREDEHRNAAAQQLSGRFRFRMEEVRRKLSEN